MPLAASESDVCCQARWTGQLELAPSFFWRGLSVGVVEVWGWLGRRGGEEGGVGWLTFFQEAGLAGGFAGGRVVPDPAVAEAGGYAPCWRRWWVSGRFQG